MFALGVSEMGLWPRSKLTVPSLFAATTENSATPSTPILTMPSGYTVLAIYTGYGSITDPEFPIYVDDGSGPVEVRCYRLTRNLVRVAAGSTIKLGSNSARSVSVLPVRSFSSLTSPVTVSGTALADDGDPYLWSPTAAHVTVPTRGSNITLTAPGSGRRMVYYSEKVGSSWTPTTAVVLHAIHTGNVTIPVMGDSIALCVDDGGTLTVSGPAGTTIGGTQAVTSLPTPSYTSTVNVTANDEADLRSKVAAATSGVRVLIPAGTYTLTAALATPAAGVVIHGSTGTASDVNIVCTSAGWSWSAQRANIDIRNLTFNVAAGVGVLIHPGAGVRVQNVVCAGATLEASSSNNCFNFVSYADSDLIVNRCDFSGGFDCTGTTTGTRSTVGLRLIRTYIHGSGNGVSAQCVSTHNNTDMWLTSCHVSDSHTNVIANQNGGSVVYTEGCRASKGTRANVTANCNHYLFWWSDGFSTVAPAVTGGGFALTSILDGDSSQSSSASHSGSNAIVSTDKIRGLFIGTQNGRGMFLNGTLDAPIRLDFLALSGCTDQGFIIQNFVAPTQQVSYYNCTCANGTGLGVNSGFTSPKLKLRNVISLATAGTSHAAANCDSDYGTYDATSTAIGANDQANTNPAIGSTTLIPTASGNCDGTGDGSLYSWVGGRDYAGLPLIYTAGVAPRGARATVVASGSNVLPDRWPAV
jgi:hypothetical protein